MTDTEYKSTKGQGTKLRASITACARIAPTMVAPKAAADSVCISGTKQQDAGRPRSGPSRSRNHLADAHCVEHRDMSRVAISFMEPAPIKASACEGFQDSSSEFLCIISIYSVSFSGQRMKRCWAFGGDASAYHHQNDLGHDLHVRRCR